MLLAYSISSADHEGCLRLAKFLKWVSNQGSHDLLLATTEELIPVRNEIEELIGPLFSRVYTVTTPNLRTGWPAGPNSYFHFVAKHIYTHIPCEGWYFFEAGDCVPLRPGWLDEIEEDYKRGCRPVMGVIHTTYFATDNTSPLKTDGSHVVGTGIYPKDLPRRIPIFDSLAVATAPFDCFLQWYIVPIAYNTRLICHLWKTQGYKTQKDGSVVGEGVPGSRRFDSAPILPVDFTAAVVHGCKDDSLLNIVRGRLAASGVKAVKIDKSKKKVAPLAPLPSSANPLAPAYPGSRGGGWK